MNISWSEEANNNLVDIEDFIARDSFERAVHFVDTLIEHTEHMLTDNPRIGRVVTEIGNPEIRELIYRGYRIVYRINKKTLDVLTVFEGHRLLRDNVI
jgi:plasmid stabilization system protein ParE